MANVLNMDKPIMVIGALAERSSIRSIERMTVLLMERLRREQGPHLWAEVIEQVRKKCDELNANYGTPVIEVTIPQSGKLVVHLLVDGARTTLMATFDANSSKAALSWAYSNNRSEGGYRLLISGDNVGFNDGGSAVLGFTSPETVATRMLDGLVS
jgi:hypothetical protein